MAAIWSTWPSKRMRGVGLVAGMLLLVGCQKTPPQRPTFLGDNQADTTALKLLTMNQRMADDADRQLVRYASEDYVLMDENYWVKGLGAGDDKPLQAEEYISLEAQIYDLEGHLLTTHQAQVQVNKVEEMQAVVYVLPYMRRGDKISMLVPWYLAYGCAGNRDVPPYENVRVELMIN